MTARRGVRAVVFDLDGTLVDSREDIVRTALHALERHGAPPQEPARVLSYVGDGARALVARLFSLAPEDPAVDARLATFLAYYEAHGADRTTILPGVLDALDALAHLPLAVCTNKTRAPAELTLARLGLDARFSVVVAGGDLPANKPDPSVLRHVAARLSVEPRSLVMVGDGPQDVACGRSVSAWTVGVPSGFVPEATLRAAGPDVVLASMAELPAAVAAFDQATSE